MNVTAEYHDSLVKMYALESLNNDCEGFLTADYESLTDVKAQVISYERENGISPIQRDKYVFENSVMADAKKYEQFCLSTEEYDEEYDD